MNNEPNWSASRARGRWIPSVAQGEHELWCVPPKELAIKRLRGGSESAGGDSLSGATDSSNVVWRRSSPASREAGASRRPRVASRIPRFSRCRKVSKNLWNQGTLAAHLPAVCAADELHLADKRSERLYFLPVSKFVCHGDVCGSLGDEHDQANHKAVENAVFRIIQSAGKDP